MAEGQRRQDLQDAAKRQLDDASLLFANGRFSSSYYLAGYSAEMALKACIAKRMAKHVIPDKRFIQDIYTHDLNALVGFAGLRTALKDEQAKDEEFASYWGIVGEWTPAARYAFTDQFSAQIMIQAIGHPQSGVLRWIMQHW